MECKYLKYRTKWLDNIQLCQTNIKQKQVLLNTFTNSP